MSKQSNMNRKLFFLPILVLALNGCAKVATSNPVAEESIIDVPVNSVPGVLYVKMKSELTDLKQGQYTFHPAFYIGGKYEKRQREAGLHLWYVATFDEKLLLTKASADITSIEGADIVEYVPKMRVHKSYNDPYWSKQWDMYNDGISEDSSSYILAGCDVNVTKAWEVTTGSPDVIVAITDGGVQYDHEDLQQNMWVNQAELNGEAGVDDDGNGIVDDIYGCGFMAARDGTMVTRITVDDHGTHIAGVIAAVNNNGKGISGIAGGDGTPETGARIMTLVTSDDNYDSVYIGRAFQYAADNGAVIMNCSWAYDGATETPQLAKAAINYFNLYAGLDENDNQVGPMAGGLCIFAAGNESARTSYPSMDDNVLAVASLGADYQAAYYTNYGDWVDVAAPGGDARKQFQILSTLPDNSYGYMQGTSMAAPHVVGVAALVVSKYKGKGFTREMLFDILVNSSNPIIYEYNKNKIGKGMVDAFAAVISNDKAPEKVTDITAVPGAGAISLSIKQKKDEHGRYPYYYKVYVSEKSMASLNPVVIGRSVQVFEVAGDSSKESIGTRISGLKFNTTYYLRVVAFNEMGKYSEPSDECSLTTQNNHLPVVQALDPVSVSMKSHGDAIMRFTITDEDEQELTVRLSDGLDGASASINGSTAVVSIDALQARENTKYDGFLFVSDGIDEVKTAISYTVEANHAPVLATPLQNILLTGLKESTEMEYGKFFSDSDGETLKYTVTADPANVVTLSSSGGRTLQLSAKSYGTAKVTVVAKDTRGLSVEGSFTVLIRDGSREVDFYPNPVTDYLYVRTGADQTADVTVYSGSGAEIFAASAQQIGPFNPLKVDLSAAPSGQYYVQVKCASSVKSYPIVKR